MKEKTRPLNPDCPCQTRTCKNNRDCEKCQDYHHKRGGKTACGK